VAACQIFIENLGGFFFCFVFWVFLGCFGFFFFCLFFFFLLFFFLLDGSGHHGGDLFFSG